MDVEGIYSQPSILLMPSGDVALSNPNLFFKEHSFEMNRRELHLVFTRRRLPFFLNGSNSELQRIVPFSVLWRSRSMVSEAESLF